MTETDRGELERRIASAPLFAKAGADVWRRLTGIARLRSFAADELVWRQGDPASYFVVVQHGLIAIRRASAGGEDALIGIFGAREAIGVPAALEQGRFLGDAVVISECATVLQIRAALVLQALEHDPQMAMSVNAALLAHTRRLLEKIDVMSAGPVARRLASLFLNLSDRFGEEDRSGALLLPIPISRVRLATLVGARPETVIRVLATWRRRKLLEDDAGGFRFADRDGLEALLA